MGQIIVKLTDAKNSIDYYLLWSTIVDAPVTYGIPLNEFKKAYLKDRISDESDLEERLERVEKNVTSSYLGETVESLLSFNNAGENGETADLEYIIENYCKNRKK